MANAESGLEELALRLADALGAAQIPPTEPLASLGGPGSEAAGGTSEGSASAGVSAVLQVAQRLASSGTVGGTGGGSAGTGDPVAAEIEQLLAGGGTVDGGSDASASVDDSATAQIEQLLAGSGTAGGGSEGIASTGASAAAQVEQLVADSGTVDSMGDPVAAEIGQLVAGGGTVDGTGDSAAAQIEQLVADSGAVGGAGDSAAAQIEQFVAGSGAVGGAGDSAAQVEQLLTGSAGEDLASTADTDAALTAAVEQPRPIARVQAGTASQSSSAFDSSSQSNSGGSSALDTIGSVAASVFENELGLAPLIDGLMSLFGGSGGSTTPPPLSSYAAPESVQFEGDVYRSANTTDWSGSGGTQSGAPLPTNTQITVQVNAMDSQSFLDHSQDIANAVRQAMLNSNSLNDVVSDL